MDGYLSNKKELREDTRLSLVQNTLLGSTQFLSHKYMRHILKLGEVTWEVPLYVMKFTVIFQPFKQKSYIKMTFNKKNKCLAYS